MFLVVVVVVVVVKKGDLRARTSSWHNFAGSAQLRGCQ
jgi:hypothetical protein